MTLEQLEAAWPFVEWREPILVTVPGLGSKECCRVCIAEKGLSARELLESPYAFDSADEFVEHFAETHS